MIDEKFRVNAIRDPSLQFHQIGKLSVILHVIGELSHLWFMVLVVLCRLHATIQFMALGESIFSWNLIDYIIDRFYTLGVSSNLRLQYRSLRGKIKLFNNYCTCKTIHSDLISNTNLLPWGLNPLLNYDALRYRIMHKKEEKTHC